MLASHGEMVNTAKTPTRAMAISSPMASAISLPSNHLAIVFDTVMPAISMPQPKIMNPSDASLALPGNDTHQLLSHVSMPADEGVAHSVILDAGADEHQGRREHSREAHTHLVEDDTARIRNPKTLKMNSELPYMPKTSGVQPRWASIMLCSGDIMSTNM